MNFKKTYFGQLKFYHESKRYGFIDSEEFGELFFFDPDLTEKNIEKGDNLCFQITKSQKYEDRIEGMKVRKTYTTKSGVVIIDRVRSHVHNLSQENLLESIEKLDIDTNDSLVKQEIDLGTSVGFRRCIKVGPEDNIIYAIRKGREEHSKFVKDAEVEESTIITMVLMSPEEEEYYIILSAYAGEMIEIEPWDSRADENAINFWKNHALVFQEDEIIEDTITTECPW